MSLDVYLYGEPVIRKCICSECYNEHEGTVRPELYTGNITHNLNAMAEAAGIYKPLWRPDEIGVTKAEQLIPMLEKGLAELEVKPEHFEPFNSPNGWGLYKHFVPFVREYLDACKENPTATVEVSR